MIRLTRTAAVVLSLLTAAHVFPVPAEAQLGSLARKARQAVQDKAEDALPFTPLPAPEFDDRLLEITEPQLALMLQAFDAEVSFAKTAEKDSKARAKAYDKAIKAYDKAMKDYQKKYDKYEACAEDFRTKEEAASAANEAKINKPLEEMNSEEWEDYMLDLAERGERISQETLAGRTDPEFLKRRDEYVRDSQAMLVEQSRRVQLVMAGQAAEHRREATEDPRLIEACGEAPVAPVAPESDPVLDDAIMEIGAETAQLTLAQYAVMRERVLYWAQEGGRPSGMGYSEGEMVVLKAGKGDIEKVVVRMKKAQIRL